MRRILRDDKGFGLKSQIMPDNPTNDKQSSNIGARLTRSYLLALALVAVSIFGGWQVLHSFLLRSGQAAEVINVAGAQRMLSQRISGISLMILQSDSDEPALTAAFEKALARMTAGNLRLTTGEHAPARETPEIMAHYFGQQVDLNARVLDFLAAATRFIADPRDPGAAAAMHTARAEAFSPLLVDLDAAVTMYQADASQREVMIRQVHLAITLFALAVVVLEGFFIFRPVARMLGRQADELTRRNATMNLVFALIPAGIAIWRKSDGAIVKSNPMFDSYCGMTLPPVTDGDNTPATAVARLLLQTDAPYEFALHDETQRMHSLRVTGRSFVREGDTVNVTLVEDLTQERNRAAELAQALKKAEQVNEAKSRFTASVSHEIRTPLNGLMGMIELMAQDTLAVQQAHRLDIARDSASHLMDILNDILDAASFEAGAFSLNFAPTDLRSLVKNTVANFEGRASAQGLTLQLRVDAHLPDRVVTDPVRMRQAVSNLIGNALKFTETGGVAVVFTLRNAYLRIEVTDTGPGILQADQARLFKRFVQLEDGQSRMPGGTGLGLSITHDIVVAMGGRIGVISQPGHGSTFWCEVPLRPCTADDHVIPFPQKTGGKGPRSILVADDSNTNRMIAGQMLKVLGYEAVFAVDGEDAREQAASGQHDLIFMDLQMPRLGGLEAALSILASPTATRIAIFGLTAHHDEATRNECLRVGMVGVLTKPTSIKDLKLAIEIAFPGAEPLAKRVDGT